MKICDESGIKAVYHYKNKDSVITRGRQNVTSTSTRQTDRQTYRYFIDRNKSHYRLICHSNKIDICKCIYKNVSLLKSYDNIHGIINN